MNDKKRDAVTQALIEAVIDDFLDAAAAEVDLDDDDLWEETIEDIEDVFDEEEIMAAGYDEEDLEENEFWRITYGVTYRGRDRPHLRHSIIRKKP